MPDASEASQDIEDSPGAQDVQEAQNIQEARERLGQLGVRMGHVSREVSRLAKTTIARGVRTVLEFGNAHRAKLHMSAGRGQPEDGQPGVAQAGQRQPQEGVSGSHLCEYLMAVLWAIPQRRQKQIWVMVILSLILLGLRLDRILLD